MAKVYSPNEVLGISNGSAGEKIMFKSTKYLGILGLIFLTSLSSLAQSSEVAAPAIVQPGAPGEPTRSLPANTEGKLPLLSKKDVEFMQGMIMHHAQAVEMTALIEERTENKDVRMLGAKISQSQADEMEFMKRWLRLRGQSTDMLMPKASGSHSHGGHSSSHQMQMPGMLSTSQMNALAKAKGAEFDRLFLLGMIQHHEGALVMVDDLFNTPGAGEDSELFNFASDVDSGQRSEINSMRNLLNKNSVIEKP